jgi:hypothetical protein
MKRSTGLSSRMSSYSYPAKKNAWKWTPAKIAAFSMFGFMMVAIIYFESNSSRSSFETPASVIEEPSFSTETSDFDKEYQDFLKRGKKIVTEETIDSLKQLQSSAQTVPPVSKAPTLNTQPSNNQSASTTKSTAPVQAPARTPDIVVESKLEQVELRPPANNSAPPSSLNKITLGTLEEVSPTNSDFNFSSKSEVESEVLEDKTITEEFYIEETITGTIAAASDGSAIQGATVTVKDTNRSAVSDSNGQYSIVVPGDPQHRTLQYSYGGNITERDVSPGANVINIRF